MRRKIVAFDLDGTLAPSKSPLPDRMAELLPKLIEKFQILVISGGKFKLFERQLLANLNANPKQLANLHLMPTSGTRYYRFEAGKWVEKYAEDIPQKDKSRIIKALEESLDESGYREKKTYGPIIEDRESQISLSIFGQEIVQELGEEGLKIKESWDPDASKKLRLREIIAPKIPDYEVRAAGATTIDVTKPGIDKAYGMRKLMEATAVSMEDILFIGDRLVEGGNDYPVKAMGIDCMEVASWHDTALIIQAILNVV